MSYYMGDFYRGDPGIGSFFKGLASTVAGFIPGVGPLASKAISAIKTGGAKTAAAATTAIVKHPVLSAAGAAGAAAVVGAAGERMIAGPGGMVAHRGHVLKHCGMPLKSGKIGKCHRRMNVCNPRALRRSIRRTMGFAKLAMRTIHIVHPKKKGHFGGFKKKRRA